MSDGRAATIGVGALSALGGAIGVCVWAADDHMSHPWVFACMLFIGLGLIALAVDWKKSIT
jgi:hypothetical protein